MRSLSIASLLLASAAISPALHAQAAGTATWADSVSSLVAKAMAANSPAMLDEAVALADRVLAVTPKDGVMLHYKGYALYRKGNLMLGARARESELKPVLEEADAVLEASAAVLKWPETSALQASVLGQLIGIGGMLSGMRLGPKADNLFDEAMRIDPANPRVFMLRGIGSIYKPKMFGGGSDKAERDLRKALELFATHHPVSPAPAWGHAEAWAWLGQVLAGEKKVDDARKAYQEALAIDPGYTWVARVLLPALDNVKR
ncbi:MAG: tetratricopeptide repeat protein [Cytophagaceae bacterium]|nr:tetratricopeptide repeat protein [Gemmatimonadaceae bacterium]